MLSSSKKIVCRQVFSLLANGINTQFNLLSHLPNMGQEVKLEIGSPTKHRWIDTTSCLLNVKALLPFLFIVFKMCPCISAGLSTE